MKSNDETEEEGQAVARAAVYHLINEGAGRATIPVEVDGKPYLVIITGRVRWQQEQQELQDALALARHTHQNSGIQGDDSCKRCGHDLRHKLHHPLP